jgi:magnesium-transporting ATPase (P-type)
MDGPPAMTLGVEPARAGIMDEPPRSKTAAILSAQRLWRIGLYGVTMAVGTLGAYAWALQGGDAARAGTLAFTTFVLFQFFNIFNARAEHGSAFNAQFFSNGKLWLPSPACSACRWSRCIGARPRPSSTPSTSARSNGASPSPSPPPPSCWTKRASC